MALHLILGLEKNAAVSKYSEDYLTYAEKTQLNLKEKIQ
jgi:hypothetical protein